MKKQDHLSPALLRARDWMLHETPLQTDCGRLCGAACCQAEEGGESGMLLFPTEREAYRDAPWARVISSAWIVKNEPVSLLICKGDCPREDRPLACRLFPLSLQIQEDRPLVSLDPRGWAVCPLMDSGLGGLRQSFVDAAQQTLDLLWQDEEQRSFLLALDQMLRELQAFPF